MGARRQRQGESQRSPGVRLHRRGHQRQSRRSCQRRLHRHVRWEQRALPQVPGAGLSEQVGGVDGRHDRQRDAGYGRGLHHALRFGNPGDGLHGEGQSVRADDETAPHQPGTPLWFRENEVEPLGMLEVGDEEHSGDG